MAGGCLLRHKWQGCVCDKCGARRDTGHDWDENTCRICGKKRSPLYLDAYRCALCGKTGLTLENERQAAGDGSKNPTLFVCPRCGHFVCKQCAAYRLRPDAYSQPVDLCPVCRSDLLPTDPKRNWTLIERTTERAKKAPEIPGEIQNK